MAYINATRAGQMAQKRGVSVLVVEVNDNMLEAAKAPLATGNLKVAMLPENSVITKATALVSAASDAATSAKIKLGTTEGGEEICADVDLKAVGAKDAAGNVVPTGSGLSVYATLTVSGAATTIGKSFIAVEYIECTKHNGEFTRFE